MFTTEMLDPEAIVKQSGLNAKPLIVSVPVSLVAFSDVQSLLPPPPPPQAAPVSATTTAVASKALVMWFPPVGCSGILVAWSLRSEGQPQFERDSGLGSFLL